MPSDNRPRNIITSFLLRTAVVIVLVAVMASIFFYWFELRSFKQELALNFRINAWDIFKHHKPLGSETDIHDIKRYMESRVNLDRRIMKLALYDENFKLLHQVLSPEFHQEILKKCAGAEKLSSRGLDEIKIDICSATGMPLVLIAAPIRNVSNQIIGYVEVVEKAGHGPLAFFRQKRLITMAASVFFVLLLALFLFPLVLQAYRELKKQERMLLVSNIFTVKSLGDAIALRDNDTSLHNFRVTLYAIAFGEELNLSRREMQGLIKGAFLHDIGKIGISDSILLKESKLTEKEFETIKTHVELGAKIVEKDPWFKDALDVIRYHHERYAGGGYPNSIKATDIPFKARIFAIVDVFDALTSDRPYRGAYKLEKANAILKEGAGTQFDAELLEIFFRIAPELYRDIAHLDRDVLERLLKEKVEHYFL